jgi:hypothetical protein
MANNGVGCDQRGPKTGMTARAALLIPPARSFTSLRITGATVLWPYPLVSLSVVEAGNNTLRAPCTSSKSKTKETSSHHKPRRSANTQDLPITRAKNMDKSSHKVDEHTSTRTSSISTVSSRHRSLVG